MREMVGGTYFSVGFFGVNGEVGRGFLSQFRSE